MRYFIIVFILGFLTFIPYKVLWAQDVSAEPICFTIKNTAPYTIYGEIMTDHYTTTDGTKARHTGTFRLSAKGTLHEEKGYPLDMSEFCTTGPFYPNRQVILTLRTLIPTFSCKTAIEQREITIHGIVNEDGTTKSWAECY